MRAVDLPWGLGTVTPLSVSETCDWILAPKPERERPYVLGNLNLHALHLALHDGPVKTLTASSDVVLIDGWPVLQLARMSAPAAARPTAKERIGSTDWLAELIERDPDICVVSVGGTATTAAAMAEYAANRTTSLRWHAFDGYEYRNRSAADGDDLHQALKRADLVLVGLGMPNQEAWILDHWNDLSPTSVVANVGGCFDYFAGTQKLAPRWMGALGMEWLFRLLHSPRRLGRRYLLEPWSLAGRLVHRHIKNDVIGARAEERTSA